VVLAEASARLSAEAGVHVVAADPAVLTVALDKWETCRFLATHGLRHPGHARPEHPVERAEDEVSAATWGCEDGSVPGPVPEPVLPTGTARRFWTEQYDDEARLS
jgi:hypothetical protein